MGQEIEQTNKGSPTPLPVSTPVENQTAFKCLINMQWWKNACWISLLYARHCMLPAGLWLGSLIVFLLPSIFIVATFGGKTVQMAQLIQALFVYLVTLLIAVPMLFWCFGAWLVRLTAFCQAFDTFSRAELCNNLIVKSRILEAHRSALSQTKNKKVFLAKFWSTLSLFLAVPCFVFFVSMLVIACTSPSVLGSSALALPQWALLTAEGLCLVSGLGTSIASFVGICVSAVTGAEPVHQAKHTLTLSMKYFLPLTLISSLSLFVSVLVTSPHELFQGSQSATIGSINVTWESVAQELWRALSSTVIWTVTLAPVCEFMRDKLESSRV